MRRLRRGAETDDRRRFARTARRRRRGDATAVSCIFLRRLLAQPFFAARRCAFLWPCHALTRARRRRGVATVAEARARRARRRAGAAATATFRRRRRRGVATAAACTFRRRWERRGRERRARLDAFFLWLRLRRDFAMGLSFFTFEDLALFVRLPDASGSIRRNRLAATLDRDSLRAASLSS